MKKPVSSKELFGKKLLGTAKFYLSLVKGGNHNVFWLICNSCFTLSLVFQSNTSIFPTFLIAQRSKKENLHTSLRNNKIILDLTFLAFKAD